MIDELKKSPITNILSQAALLAIESKECEFKLREEQGYANTPNEHIRKVFGHHFDNMSEDDLTALKHNNESFFNSIYGGLYGNGPSEGWKFRGRGPNQTTFKGNYQVVQDRINKFLPEGEKIDLIAHPDLLNDPRIGSKGTIAYFLFKFDTITSGAVADIHAHGINDFKTIDDALLGFYRANAGWGKQVFPDVTGGYAKAKARVNEFLEILKA
jgi:predicted chitinase